MLGTSHYIAPEQARGESVDAQTDVYSFGVVLYELLAGDVPYPGDSFLSVAMKHVNDEVPSVLERRPDAPLRLASLIESCMAKLPAGRPASMDAVVGELGACLAELDGKDGGEATMIVKATPAAKPKRATSLSAPRKPFRVGPVLLVALLLAAVVGGILLTRGDGRDPKPAAADRDAVRLRGVASFDPQGDNEEHSERVQDATDGDPATYWTTERYSSFSKPGVGLVLDAGEPSELSQIAVTTDTPGFRAEIRAGSSPQGPFDTVVGPSRTVGESTTWDLDRRSTTRSGSRSSTGWPTSTRPSPPKR